MRTKPVVIQDTQMSGGEILIGPANGLVKSGKLEVSVLLKFVKGSKVISGWFNTDELIKIVQNLQEQEARRLDGLVEQEARRLSSVPVEEI